MNSIPIIINPAAGKKTPVLAEINQVFHQAGIPWSVEVTLGEGDGIRHARRLAEEGAEIVAVYGGDGTVSEVATGLAGTNAALAILPGGTGNVLTYELGTPRELVAACQLLASEHTIRTIDMGAIEERRFLLRAGVGLEALAIEKSPRKLKDRFGLFAYGIGGLQALLNTKPMRYQLDLDGESVEAEGVACTVANSGHLGGFPGLTLSPLINIEDGLLDVIVLRKADIKLIIQVVSEKVPRAPKFKKLQHWQVKRMAIRADPPQTVQVDGDNLGVTPVEMISVPHCLRVVVPMQA
jgi:YegS/Rv2252/BmrU family lipid kinase